MDLNEYQEKAISYCSKKCFNFDYLEYRYLGEVGEVAGKLADRIRGDVVTNTDIMYEIGDVAWVIAVKAAFHKKPFCINKDLIGFDKYTVHFLKDANTPSIQLTILRSLTEGMGFDF